MPEPTLEMCQVNAEEFYKKLNYPNCIGGLDGKHNYTMYKSNRKWVRYFSATYVKFFSTVRMALVDDNLRFVDLDVGSYGKDGDWTSFKDSELGENCILDL